MKNSILLVFLFLSINYIYVIGQNVHGGICGTHFTKAQIDRIDKLKKVVSNVDLRANKNMIIKFHIIRDNDGFTTLKFQQLFDVVDYVNEIYEDELGVHIHLGMHDGKFFNFIDNSDFRDDPSSDNASFELKEEREDDAINVFVAFNAKKRIGPGTVLGYYTPAFDYIVCKENVLGYAQQTLPHELGHFFSLFHTFYGWEGLFWTEEEFGDTVTITRIGGVPVELMDGSNSDVAADRVADTPPDYNFAFSPEASDCGFYKQVYDSNYDLIDPMEDNLMSYFGECASYRVTEGQVGIIRADIASSRRNPLMKDFIPREKIDSVPIVYLNNFQNGQLMSIQDKIDWEDIPNAEAYVVKFDIFKSFASPHSSEVVVYESEVSFEDYKDQFDGLNMYFKIKPFNATHYKADFFDTQKVKFGERTAVNSIPTIGKILLYPNPVTRNSLNVMFSSNSNITADISIHGVDGVEKHTQELQVHRGRNYIKIPTNQYSPGVYIVRVTSGNNSTQQKIIIQ